MKKCKFIELDEKALLEERGGSALSDAVSWFLGALFITPGKMAVDGAAGHEIMGSK
ncbi:MAG: hypothetical protein PWQ17_799 [Anaerophaga sp.]|jgi:hypothetical protein|nr:hypothetical protein [Proteiniphilum sp.]MDK2841294.1 hypothetical protein [Anaerophaga sp.]